LVPRTPTPKAFQYLCRATLENSALRANRGKFIGKRRSDFRFGGAELGAFGLLIINPPL
jgi:hypothetical protein